LSQDDPIGVKWKVTFGLRSSQARTAGQPLPAAPEPASQDGDADDEHSHARHRDADRVQLLAEVRR
jgi:hypothetical protein